MAGPLRRNGPFDPSRYLVVGLPAPKRRQKIELSGGEEAGPKLPLRGQPNAIAVATERLRDGGDDANLGPRSIMITVEAAVEVTEPVSGGRRPAQA